MAEVSSYTPYPIQQTASLPPASYVAASFAQNFHQSVSSLGFQAFCSVHDAIFAALSFPAILRDI